MTREEAREALSVLKIYDAQWLREAVDMAIEALSAENSNAKTQNSNQETQKSNGDLIYRADAIEAVKETKPIVRSTERNWGKMIAEQHSKELVKALKALPSAESVHKPDYSYEADMVRRLKKALSADTSSDLISRANAIRWVKTECNPYGKPTLDYDSGLKVIEHLKKMPSELQSAEAEWIPCSERVPKENEYVDNVCKYYLIQDEYGDMHVAHLSGRGWETIESIKALGCDVIAWMPLPKPYRKDGEDE